MWRARDVVKYFKPKDGLPDPKGPLSQSLPSRVIAAAKVNAGASGKRAEYHK